MPTVFSVLEALTETVTPLLLLSRLKASDVAPRLDEPILGSVNDSGS